MALARAPLWLATVAAIGSLTVCVELRGYRCGADDECDLAGRTGLCQPDGVCSYADEDCASGQRYESDAGELGGECVPPGPAPPSSGGGGEGGVPLGGGGVEMRATVSSSSAGGAAPASCEEPCKTLYSCAVQSGQCLVLMEEQAFLVQCTTQPDCGELVDLALVEDCNEMVQTALATYAWFQRACWGGSNDTGM